MRRLTRRFSAAIVGALLFAALPTGLHAQEKAQDLIPFELGAQYNYWNAENIPFIYGADAGIFRDAGIDFKVKFLDTRDLTAAVVNGSVDASTWLPSAYHCYKESALCNLTIALVTGQVSPYYAFTRVENAERYRKAGGLAGSLYRDPSDPDDWQVVAAVNDCKGMPTVLFKTVVQQRYPDIRESDFYCDPPNPEKEAGKRVIMRPIGGSSARLKAVAAGDQGTNLGLDFFGKPKKRAQYADTIAYVGTVEEIEQDFNLPMTGLVVRTSMPKEKLCRFVEGYRAVVKEWREHPDRAKKYLRYYYAKHNLLPTEEDPATGEKKQVPLSDEQAEEIYQMLVAMMPLDGTIPEEARERLIKATFVDAPGEVPMGLFSFDVCSN